MSMHKCVICGNDFLGGEDRGICSFCKSRPRVRTIATLLNSYIVPEFGPSINLSKKALCFSTTVHERKLLSEFFTSFESVSLFGVFGNPCTSGVDARDLARYEDNSYSAHYSCLLFDYFTEHEQALKEAFRVLAPGGIFITHLEAPRIETGHSEPRVVSTIKPRPGYYDYIPDGEGMVSVKVGKDWFYETMNRSGFVSYLFNIVDESSGVECDWFVGFKPQLLFK